MIELLGWLTFILGGAYAFFSITAVLMGLRGGGLEALPRILVVAVVAAICWIAFAVWLSPISVSFQ